MALPAVWDFIVVGGGIAGTVISSRLHQYNSSLQILMIEAGSDASGRADLLYPNTTNDAYHQFTWDYASVPQVNMDNRVIDQPAGRGIGGGSITNGCEYHQSPYLLICPTNTRQGRWFRGDIADYNEWADLVGDDRWGYDSMLPYFRMSEQWFSETENEEQHGHDGPIYVTTPSNMNRTYPLSDEVESSWKTLGVPEHPYYDMNAGNNLGLGELNENRIEGRRQIANTRYSLEGVTVLTETMVAEIVLDTSGAAPRATGVELRNGTQFSAREVILSAGAYRSPQILMLSGIGPSDQLTEHGIRVHVDAADVGQHFRDHFQLVLNWRLRDPSQGYAIGSSNPLFSEPQYGLGSHISWVTSTVGPREGLISAIEADEGAAPDPDAHYLLRTPQASMETLVDYEANPNVPGGGGTVAVDGTHISSVMVGLKPTSRGSVRLRSADIDDYPLVDPNYFATAVDRWAWREGVRDIVELMTGDTALGRDIIEGETPPPGARALTTQDADADIEARVRAAGYNTYHPMGSCSMGRVVDPDLRVIGVEGLRVVDASVIPIAIGAHTQAPVYALAEHAAALIAGEA